MTKPIRSETFHNALAESFYIKRVLNLGVLALILGTVALPAPTAWAASDYVISSDATVTNGGAGRLTSIGDTLTITTDGSVTTTDPNLHGVDMTNRGQTITHNGPIMTTGDDAIGIAAGYPFGITGDVTILGSGSISTVGGYAYGIFSDVLSGDAKITAGDITTAGVQAFGISSDVSSGNATITADNITTAGWNAIGIYSFLSSGRSTIAAGNISTAGQGAAGIDSYVSSGYASITVGDITTTGVQASGISSSANSGDAKITAGNITTAGWNAVGINSYVSSGSASITVGDITTTGVQASGIFSFANSGSSTITAGNISTAGQDAYGIDSGAISGSFTITAGNILTAGQEAYGIYSYVRSGDASITAGDITTAGVGAHGVFSMFSNSETANLSIVNDHTIAVTGAGAVSIYLDTLNDHVRISNTGTIFSAQDYGIYATGTDTIISNSGMISGYAGAVKFAGTGNTLSLLAGSKIVGLLDIAGTGGNTLSIGKRLNTALAYTFTPTLTVEPNDIPYALADVGNNRVVAVVDPTLFAAEDDMVADLSRSVGNAVDARLGSAAGASFNNIIASSSNALATRSKWDTWATGIASSREQGEEGLNDGFDTTLGGFTLGSDTVLSSGMRFGGFVGASHGHLITNAGNEQIDSASTYAGLYARYTLPDAFVNLALTGGYDKADTSRDVLNNMVTGGIEQAKGNPNGLFITPQATIGTQIKTSSGFLTPSLRVAYTHLTMDSYAETGSTANISVGARTVSTLDLRGQVAFAIRPVVTASGQIDATMRVGADATFTNSDDISATVLGQPLTFSTTQDTALRGFAGLDVAQAMDNGAKLNLSVEAGYGSNSAVTLQGMAGLVWAF